MNCKNEFSQNYNLAEMMYLNSIFKRDFYEHYLVYADNFIV